MQRFQSGQVKIKIEGGGLKMTVEIKETAEAGALELHVSGALTQADHEHFVPVVERLLWIQATTKR